MYDEQVISTATYLPLCIHSRVPELAAAHMQQEQGGQVCVALWATACVVRVLGSWFGLEPVSHVANNLLCVHDPLLLFLLQL